MGIKDFTKVFENSGEFQYKNFKDKNVVIDASVEIYRSALGMKLSEALTDKSGNPTAHINVILLGVILKLKASDANQYWIFDHDSNASGIKNHNPLKELELKKRKAKKEVAKSKITELNTKLQNLEVDDLFSDSDISDDEEDNKASSSKDIKAQIKIQIDKQEKAAFTMQSFYIEDIKFILTMLEIPWIECPAGFDAEQLAAISTNNKNIFGVKMDYVLTSDADALLFGSKVLIKRDIRKKKLFKYELAKILEDNDLTMQDFIKIGLILGTDFAEKTPRIGPKTVLQKYKNTTLSEAQTKALNENFNRKITTAEIESITLNNKDLIPFTNVNKYKELLDWLQLVKDYNRDRIIKQFEKIKLFV
jgi:hypothetical protein